MHLSAKKPDGTDMIESYEPLTSPATDRGLEIFTWLEPHLLPRLSEEQEAAYDAARSVRGAPAQVRVPGFGLCRVRGECDDVYGHHCLRAVIRNVVRPMIETEEIDVVLTQALRQRLRELYGDLAVEAGQALKERMAAPRGGDQALVEKA
jgi:hypothetical protein